MTIAFFFILLINCMVIFAVDALLPAPTTTTTVIVVNGTTVSSPLSDGQLLALTASTSAGNRTLLPDLLAPAAADEVHRPVVARKGVNAADAGPSDEDVRVASSKAATASTPVLDKTPTAPQTTSVATTNTTTATGHRPRVDTSITTNAKSPPAAVGPSSSSSSSNTSTPSAPTRATNASNQSTTVPSASTIRSTTTSTTAATTTTTPKPTKPKITFSVAELPPQTPAQKAAAAALAAQSLSTVATSTIGEGAAAAAAADAPHLEPSRELRLDDDAERNAAGRYVIPIVTLIFAVPMVIGVGIVLTRRFRYYWSTRHYRRMDFLVDGMYNS